MCERNIFYWGGRGGGEEKSMKRIHFLKIYLLFFLCDVHFPTCLFSFFVKLAVTFHTELVFSKIPSLFVCAFIFVCLWFSGFLFFCFRRVSQCSSRLECLQLSGHDSD